MHTFTYMCACVDVRACSMCAFKTHIVCYALHICGRKTFSFIIIYTFFFKCMNHLVFSVFLFTYCPPE